VVARLDQVATGADAGQREGALRHGPRAEAVVERHVVRRAVDAEAAEDHAGELPAIGSAHPAGEAPGPIDPQRTEIEVLSGPQSDHALVQLAPVRPHAHLDDARDRVLEDDDTLGVRRTAPAAALPIADQ